MGDRHRHDDDRHAGADRREPYAEPTRTAHGAQDDERDHDRDGQGGVDRAQDEHRNGEDDGEHHWNQLLRILPGLDEGLTEDHVAGQVVGEVRMGGSGPFKQIPQVNRNLGPLGLLRFGQGEAHRHPSHAPVPGDQLPDELGFVQRNGPDPVQRRAVERRRVLDQGCDRQVVAGRRAMKMVGERADPDRVRRPPRGLGQFLDRGEGLAGEHRALSRRDGDQRRPRCGVGILQLVEGEKVWIVLAEQHAIAAGHREAGRSRGQGQHDERGKRQRGPAVAQNQGRIAMREFNHHGFDPGRRGATAGRALRERPGYRYRATIRRSRVTESNRKSTAVSIYQCTRQLR